MCSHEIPFQESCSFARSLKGMPPGLHAINRPLPCKHEVQVLLPRPKKRRLMNLHSLHKPVLQDVTKSQRTLTQEHILAEHVQATDASSSDKHFQDKCKFANLSTFSFLLLGEDLERTCYNVAPEHSRQVRKKALDIHFLAGK